MDKKKLFNKLKDTFEKIIISHNKTKTFDYYFEKWKNYYNHEANIVKRIVEKKKSYTTYNKK